MRQKASIFLCASAILLSACGSEGEEPGKKPGTGQEGEFGQTTEITYTPTLSLTTDKAMYSPGDAVKFKAVGTVPAGAKIRYVHQGQVVAEENYAGDEWTWTAPSADKSGYMVDIYTGDENGETVYGAIAVDVSSSWAFFPRYGFVADFGQKPMETIEEEMDYLLRCHINGVQFQDWHNKHHWPLGSTRNGEILDVYKDIANRDTYRETIENYIDVQHRLGMKSIFYNLCFGALDDAEEDGVKPEWFVYKDYMGNVRDSHDLPDSWKSDIYLVNPANKGWQNYLIERNEDVYNHLDFDGYQIDQLGNRGKVFDAYGNELNLPQGYNAFIKAMKNARPEKDLIMNAVSRYGAQEIAESEGVEFLYNEVWRGEEAQFSHLKIILDENDRFSKNRLKTVFAAYMNYDKADSKGKFNNPGVILTDAVMFALGGSHLELGDHMLCKEYFPNNNLEMDDELKNAMVNYYDFLTGYENLLRDGGSLSTEISVKSADGKLKMQAWPPLKGAVCTIARRLDKKDVIHLLNFSQANSTEWRDANGSMPKPSYVASPKCSIAVDREVESVWMASPDIAGGVKHPLAYSVKNGVVEVTLPSLLYWDMIVVEYK